MYGIKTQASLLQAQPSDDFPPPAVEVSIVAQQMWIRVIALR
jgi:hypothetical protein